MITLDYSRDESLLYRAAKLIDAEYDPKMCVWFKVSRNGVPAGVFILYHFSSGNAEMSCATFGSGAWSRSLFRALAQMFFVQYGLRRVTCLVHPGNVRSQQIVQKFNFKLEGMCRGWFPDAPGLLYGLTKEDCKWLC